MSMKRTICIALFSMNILAAANAATVFKTIESDTVQLVIPFNLPQSTQVPGKTLKTGNYSIRIVDHLSDRMIVQIEDSKGASQARFLALTNPDLQTSDRSTGPLSWANGPDKVKTLRGFAFPGGLAIEFVYPKNDAVSIAKLNTDKVPAIDPASEGVTSKNLSKEDLQTVTLWTLLLTKVGSGGAAEPAIEAVRYQAPTQQSASALDNVQTLHGSTAGRSMVSNSTSVPPSQKARPTSQPRQIAANKPLLTALPHTASEQGLISLIGFLALGLGASIHYARFAARKA